MEIIKPEVEHGIVGRIEGSVNNNFGWPSVCRDKRGVLWAAGSGGRLTHVDPTGKNYLYMSLDDGKTWSLPMILNNSYLDDRDTGVYAWGEGNMIATWFSLKSEWTEMLKWEWLSGPQRAIIEGYGKTYQYLSEEELKDGSFVKVSKDWGITWSDKIRVPVTSPHGPIALKDGTLVYMGKQMNPEYLAPNPIEVYSSYDGGYTWEYTGKVEPSDDITNENMHEPHLVELPSGRLLGSIRIHGRNKQPDFTVYTTYSDDKGKTWSKPQCIECDGAPPHLMVHSSGAIICSYSRRRSDNDRGERAIVSYDGGETWTEDYDLRNKFKSGDHGYPASVELSDGSILTVYYMSYEDDWQCSILSTKWRLKDR